MLTEDHEMGLFPQKKKTANKQTTEKAVSNSMQAGSRIGAVSSARSDAGSLQSGFSLPGTPRPPAAPVKLPLRSGNLRPQPPPPCSSGLPLGLHHLPPTWWKGLRTRGPREATGQPRASTVPDPAKPSEPHPRNGCLPCPGVWGT